MPKEENSPTLTVAEMAQLLRVTPRQVRNWITDKGLPAQKMPGVQRLNGAAVIAWYVDFRLAEKGNSGNRRGVSAANLPDQPEESYDEALARKTRAEADLKELQLARERGEAAAISDVEKALASANSATKTLIQALPARLSTQLLGIDDRAKLFEILTRETNGLLSNLATVGSVLEAGKQPAQVEEP